MALCSNLQCPLSFIHVDKKTSGESLVLSFICNTHQPNVIYTPEQLNEIHNEILFMVKKYEDCKKVTEQAYRLVEPSLSDETVNRIRDMNIQYYDDEQDSYEREFIQKNGNSRQTRTNKAHLSEKSTNDPILQNEQIIMITPKKQVAACKPVDHEPYLSISFKEIYDRTGFMGLRRLESMERLSKCVKKPLGCCYDEIRELWAIADSHNNRVVLYPEGITIESPKFVNPATVCVLDPGQRLAILSDCCLATYTYDDQNFSIIVEANGTGQKLRCRGLCRTPRGNLATIQRIGPSHNIVIYDMSSPNNYEVILSTIPLPFASNPSFCAINGNRMVVTDLGNQTLTLVIFTDDELNAEVRSTKPLQWYDKTQEPNGRFNFVSGVQMDRNGWVIVADAGGHTIQLFDENLNFVTRLSHDFNLPYMSSICINNQGQIVTLGRHNNDISLSELVQFNELTPLPKLTNWRPSAGNYVRGASRGNGGYNRGTRGGQSARVVIKMPTDILTTPRAF